MQWVQRASAVQKSFAPGKPPGNEGGFGCVALSPEQHATVFGTDVVGDLSLREYLLLPFT